MEEVVDERRGKGSSRAVRGGREQSLVNRGEQEKSRRMSTTYQQTPALHPTIQSTLLFIHISGVT